MVQKIKHGTNEPICETAKERADLWLLREGEGERAGGGVWS